MRSRSTATSTVGVCSTARRSRNQEVSEMRRAVLDGARILLALIVALLVHKNTKINRIFRTTYLLPLGVSIVVASSIWVLLLNPNDGLVNSLRDPIRKQDD
jgi:ABC-type polysaccharide transport system permease subunit